MTFLKENDKMYNLFSKERNSKIKKFLTNEKHFDRINKLSQDRELKTEFKKIKKVLDKRTAI